MAMAAMRMNALAMARATDESLVAVARVLRGVRVVWADGSLPGRARSRGGQASADPNVGDGCTRP
jgi:hypothetical protein